MEPLSTAQEIELSDAIKTATRLVTKQKFSPNDAFEKVARDECWGPDMIKFACRAYNTGRQAFQRDSKEGMGKHAAFELADASQVISSIFSEEKSSALDMSMILGVSKQYNEEPSFIQAEKEAKLLERHMSLAEEEAAKEAAEKEPEFKPVTFTEVNRERLVAKKAHDEANLQVGRVEDELRLTGQKLASHFRRMQLKTPFHVFEKCCQQYFPKAAAFIDYVHANYQLKAKRCNEKTAATYDENDYSYELVKQALNQANDLIRLKAEAEKVSESLKEAEENLKNFGKEKPGNTKQSVSIGAMLGSGIGTLGANLFKSPETSAATESAQIQLMDPEFDEEMQRITAQTNLAELMDDEVISGYDPSQVLKTYNEVVNMSPAAAAKPMLLRSLIRKNLGSNAEPFELKEITDIDRVINTDTGTPIMPLHAAGNK